jgi:hypothetical protein
MDMAVDLICGITVTVQEADVLFATVLAVIVTLPAFFVVISPLLFTVAIALFDDDHLILPLGADAVSCSFLSTRTVAVFFDIFTGSFTVSLSFAFLPLEVFAVIVVLPVFFAVMKPAALTVATFLFDEENLIVFVAFFGVSFTVGLYTLLTLTDLVFVIVIFFAFFFFLTTLILIVSFLPFFVFTVIVAVPALMALTLPVLLIFATLLLEVEYDTVLSPGILNRAVKGIEEPFVI